VTILKASTFKAGDTVDVYEDPITKLVYEGNFNLHNLVQVIFMTSTMQLETWEGYMVQDKDITKIRRKFLAGRPV